MMKIQSRSINLGSDTKVPDCSLLLKIDTYFQEQANKEYLHISHKPQLVTGETIAFFHQHIRPEKFFTRLLEKNSMYKRNAIVYFLNLGDPTKTMLKTLHGLSIHTRKVKVKLFINGLQKVSKSILWRAFTSWFKPIFPRSILLDVNGSVDCMMYRLFLFCKYSE